MTLSFLIQGVLYNLVSQYGSVSIEQVRAHAQTYNGMQTRHAQNADQIYVCLAALLTNEAMQRVALDANKYTIGDDCDGLLYFKVIVGLAHIDTRATVTMIRRRLCALDTKMTDVQDNIVELNAFVKTQQDSLTARGEKMEDLLVNLFMASMACSDQEFLTWVKEKENQYNEGANFSPEELMMLADNKYNSLVENGKRMQQSEDQQRIVALTAQVQSWEKVKSKSSHKPGSKVGGVAPTRRPRRAKARIRKTNPEPQNPSG
jgi:hypothetical protein